MTVTSLPQSWVETIAASLPGVTLPIIEQQLLFTLADFFFTTNYWAVDLPPIDAIKNEQRYNLISAIEKTKVARPIKVTYKDEFLPQVDITEVILTEPYIAHAWAWDGQQLVLAFAPAETKDRALKIRASLVPTSLDTEIPAIEEYQHGIVCGVVGLLQMRMPHLPGVRPDIAAAQIREYRVTRSRARSNGAGWINDWARNAAGGFA